MVGTGAVSEKDCGLVEVAVVGVAVVAVDAVVVVVVVRTSVTFIIKPGEVGSGTMENKSTFKKC